MLAPHSGLGRRAFEGEFSWRTPITYAQKKPADHTTHPAPRDRACFFANCYFGCLKALGFPESTLLLPAPTESTVRPNQKADGKLSRVTYLVKRSLGQGIVKQRLRALSKLSIIDNLIHDNGLRHYSKLSPKFC